MTRSSETYCDITRFDNMIGRTMAAIAGLDLHSEDAAFTATDGSTFNFFYEHDCCASCVIVDVVGDVEDLIGSPIVIAEEISSEGAPEPEHAESYTWTFYRFATAKGTVTVRWLGESNGYYSESVTYAETLAGAS